MSWYHRARGGWGGSSFILLRGVISEICCPLCSPSDHLYALSVSSEEPFISSLSPYNCTQSVLSSKEWGHFREDWQQICSFQIKKKTHFYIHLLFIKHKYIHIYLSLHIYKTYRNINLFVYMLYALYIKYISSTNMLVRDHAGKTSLGLFRKQRKWQRIYTVKREPL